MGTTLENFPVAPTAMFKGLAITWRMPCITKEYFVSCQFAAHRVDRQIGGGVSFNLDSSSLRILADVTILDDLTKIITFVGQLGSYR
ncbi:MAG: hypothetical protein A2284_04965 [Deltaproteobacteria bacterium RIFOXYA12_FULL_61_11]|nr:MAG: hypothetical protein A2284_04965 [Deltaproteobacteria bacterium RIFOXYA12_FULL_61_11]